MMNRNVSKLCTLVLLFMITGMNAQKVGVNTTTPQATLDIQPTPASVTANEANGILIPRLTGDQIKAMTGMEGSTMIYATSAATTAELTAKYITEPGYYYYNATDMVWVRVLTNANDKDEWVEIGTDTVDLKRFRNVDGYPTIFYDQNKKFSHILTEPITQAYTYIDANGRTVTFDPAAPNPSGPKPSNVGHKLQVHSSKLYDNYPVIVANGSNLTIDSNDDLSTILNRGNKILSLPFVSDDVTQVQATQNIVDHAGSADYKYVSGAVNRAALLANSISTGHVHGATNQAVLSASKSQARDLRGSYNVVQFKSGDSTNVSGSVVPTESLAVFVHSGTSPTVPTIKLSSSRFYSYLDATPKVGKVYGRFDHGLNATDKGDAEVNEYYGLYLESITAAKDKNFAIYTNEGKSSLGDTLQIRNLNTTTSTNNTDKVVVADADGVLKTKSASAVSAASEPWYNKDTNMGATTNTDTLYTKGYVGIGTENPVSDLHVMTPGTVQNNVVTVGDPTYNGDSALSFLDPGSNSSFKTTGLNSSVRVFGKATASNNNFQQLGESKLSAGQLDLKKMFRGTEGIAYSGVNLMTTDGVVGFTDSRTVLGRYGGLSHYSALVKNAFKIVHTVGGIDKAIFSMDNEGDMHLINGTHTVTPTMSIMSNRNVGINNPSPMADLDIKSSGDGVPALKVEKAENASHVAEMHNPGGNGRVLLLKTGGSSTLSDAYFVKGESNTGVEKFVIDANGKIKAANVVFTGIPTHADDAAAGAAGLVSGEMYKTATGELRIKL